MSDLISRAALFNACATLNTKEEIFAAIQNAKAVEPKVDTYDEDLLRYTINTFGIRSQVMMAVEEMSELSVELMHYLRLRGSASQVAEEMADVKICLMQLEMIYHNSADVAEIVSYKLQRLRERMKNGGMV